QTRTPPQVAMSRTISNPKRICVMLTVPRRMPQGMFPATLGFQRARPDEIQCPIGGRRERPECGRRQVTLHGRRIPWARPKHPQRRPIFQRGRQVRVEALERPFARIANQCHDQPTADQQVSCLDTAKMLLERVQRLIYFAWDACGTPHVSRSCAFWDVGYIQNTQERFVFQGFLRDAPPAAGCSPVTSETVGMDGRGVPYEPERGAQGRAALLGVVYPHLADNSGAGECGTMVFLSPRGRG